MITWLETDTFTGKNISSAVAIGAYTATANKMLLCDVSLDSVAGDGDYILYLKRQINGAGSDYILLPRTTMTALTGETAIGGQSRTFSVKSGDVLTLYADGLAADTAVNTIVRWYEWVENVDEASLRAAIIAQVASPSTPGTAGAIVRKRGNSWAISITDLGSLVGYTSIWFTIKSSPEDADSASIVQIKKNATGVGDGLLYLNGAAGTAAQGSITIDDATDGDITVVLDEAATATLYPGAYVQDVQTLIAAAVATPSYGTFTIESDTTRALT